jgi:hypothetical protein
LDGRNKRAKYLMCSRPTRRISTYCVGRLAGNDQASEKSLLEQAYDKQINAHRNEKYGTDLAILFMSSIVGILYDKAWQ